IAVLALLVACGEAGGAQRGATAGSSATGGSSGASAGAGGVGTGGDSAGTGGTAGTGPVGVDGGPADAEVGPDGAADGGGASSLTLPIVRGDLDVLEFGSFSFAVKPSLGARVTSFKLAGDEMLTDASANPKFFGSTLWTSPASDWVVPGTFVPPAVV